MRRRVAGRPPVIRATAVALMWCALQAPVSLVDDSGARLRLVRPVLRVVSLAPSNTESMFAIGAGDLVVGATRFDDHPDEARRIPRVGGYADVDVERVIELAPDLVLATGLQAGDLVPRLRGLGLQVFVIEPRDVAGVIDRLEVLGLLVDRRAAAARAASSLRARLRAVELRVGSTVRRPRVLMVLSRDLFTVGPGSFAHDLIVRAGGANIVADADIPYPQISDETAIARDPEVVFIAGHRGALDREQLRARPGWAQVDAVRHGRVVVMEDPDIASRPGPRLIEALEIMASAIGDAAPEPRRERPR